jgi:5-methylcytosine-specific restriction endonuclease McrA
MSAKIISFIATRITTAVNGSIANKELLEAYLKYASTTTGRNSLYKQIEEIVGVTRSKTHFKGIAFCVVAPQTIEVAQPKQESVLSAYEQMLIEMKARKITQQKENESLRMAAAKELECIRATAAKELECIRATAAKELQEYLKSQDIVIQSQALAVREKAIAVKVELKMIDVAEKQKDREFVREENNKNRRMHMSQRHNKYLDFAVYGTPASQYIECSSLVNVLGFSAYDALSEYSPELLEAIDVEATSVSKCIPVYENASTKQLNVIAVSDAMKVVDRISKQADAPGVLELISTIESISTQAVNDNCRTIPSRYVSKKSSQNKSAHGSSKHKLKYVKAVNKLHEQDGKVLINCACCHSKIDLQSSGCHRAHDIPQSDGGDWSVDNVYLTCASCNATMSDQLSVLEYKVDLYVKLIV